jgi:tRNA-splicing ligase RtcB
MGNLRTKDLSKIGYHNDQLRSLVIGIAAKNFKHYSKEQLLDLLVAIKDNPEAFLHDEMTSNLKPSSCGRSRYIVKYTAARVLNNLPKSRWSLLTCCP